MEAKSYMYDFGGYLLTRDLAGNDMLSTYNVLLCSVDLGWWMCETIRCVPQGGGGTLWTFDINNAEFKNSVIMTRPWRVLNVSQWQIGRAKQHHMVTWPDNQHTQDHFEPSGIKLWFFNVQTSALKLLLVEWILGRDSSVNELLQNNWHLDAIHGWGKKYLQKTYIESKWYARSPCTLFMNCG